MSREQLKALARPFPAKYVKKPAPGKYGTYVDHEIVTQALLFILGPFSFKVEQVFYNPDGILDGCTAALTCTIDGREVTITEVGDCENPTNSKTQGDRLKKAASDALKRCAMRLGCGIHLWAGTEGDFFLFDSLSKEDLHAIQNAEGRVAGAGNAAADSSPSAISPPRESAAAGAADSSQAAPAPIASKAQRDALKSRALAINDEKRIDRKRIEWNLPELAACDADQLRLYGEMLRDIETAMEAPFVEANA